MRGRRRPDSPDRVQLGRGPVQTRAARRVNRRRRRRSAISLHSRLQRAPGRSSRHGRRSLLGPHRALRGASGPATVRVGSSGVADGPRSLPYAASGTDADGMIDEIGTVPMSGGTAPARVFAADAVITMAADRPCKRSPTSSPATRSGWFSSARSTTSQAWSPSATSYGPSRKALDPLATPARRRAPVGSSCGATPRRPFVRSRDRMIEECVRHVLLEVDGRLVGIVSARDLLGAYAMSFD